MAERTTKTERRNARRSLGAGCRQWGTARTARLLRGGPHARFTLRVALALDVPPEALIAGDAPPVHGQYWPPTGEVLDAPHHPRMPARVAEAMADLCAELDRTFLQPRLQEIGADPGRYTLGFTLTGPELRTVLLPGPPLVYEPPQTNPWGFALPAEWGQS